MTNHQPDSQPRGIVDTSQKVAPHGPVADTFHSPDPLISITKYQDTPLARAGREHFEAGLNAGLTGLPISATATAIFRQGWFAGDVQRRIDAGEVDEFIVTCGQGSKCLKCHEVSSGLRKGCRCWPTGVYDPKRNEREGFRMEWGMLVIGSSKSHKFMSRAELLQARDSGKSIVDSLTGKPLQLSEV